MDGVHVKRLLVPSAALLWGLQFAFLNPALALVLVTLFDATASEVGWVLAVYNASGFVASLILPAYADRKADYLRPMLACGLLTLALVVLLAVTTSLPVAVIGLVTLGGPAGVGSSLLFAHLRHSGASPSDIVNTRAIVSVAWVAGPPLATLIIGAFGKQAILIAIGAVAVLNISTTAAMLAQRSASRRRASRADPAAERRAAHVEARCGSDPGRVHRPPGHERHRGVDHDPVRHRGAGPQRDLGRNRPWRRRRARDPGPAADRPVESPVLQPWSHRVGMPGRDRLLRRHGLRRPVLCSLSVSRC